MLYIYELIWFVDMNRKFMKKKKFLYWFIFILFGNLFLIVDNVFLIKIMFG